MGKRIVSWFAILVILVISGVCNNVLGAKVPVEKPAKVKTVENPVEFPVPYVPILKDWKYQSDQSAILKTTKILTGMLVYKVKYKANDLISFYRTQMPGQGWHEVGSFTSKVAFLAYKRPEGTAFISIKEGSFYTEVRIVVVLTLNNKIEK